MKIITLNIRSCTENKTPYSARYIDKLQSSGWIDSWKELNAKKEANQYTWLSNHGNGFRIDYIFLSPDLKAVTQSGSVVHDPATIQDNPERRKLSDHLAVIADLKFLT